MEVDQNSVNGHGPAESVYLFIVASQSSSYDDAKYILSQLNTSLSQIGDRIANYKNDMINTINAQNFEQTSIDQNYVISYSNESTFQFDFLVNSTLNQFKQTFKQFLQSDLKEKYFLNLTFDSNQNGDLNLNDALVTCDDIHSFLTLYSQNSSQKVNFILNQKVIDSNKNWKLLEKLSQVSVKPIHSLLNQSPNQFDDFVNLVERYFNQTSIDQLMEQRLCTGTLKIQKPSIYIFPASQGDSCYFAINGYSMLINGGYDRLRPCFWKFVNMLQQIDSVLVTHIDSDSLGGLSSFFQKKLSALESTPSVLTLLGNLVGSQNLNNLHSSPTKAANLIINELPNCTGNKSDSDLIIEAIDRLQIKLQPLVIQRPLTEKVKQNYEHVRLYSKLGYGNLDLFVLSPNVQSAEFKDFCVQQQTLISKTHKAHLAVQQVYRNLPSSHLATSVCLLVWQPSFRSDSTNSALRLLFTGNCPQNVLFSALDKLKDFDILNHPVYKIKSDTEQFSQFQNFVKKEVKVAKESIKLNTSVSKTNGAEPKQNGTAPVQKQPVAVKPPKPAATAQAPASAPVKKVDTSISKEKPVEVKKSANSSASRPSLSSSSTAIKTEKSSVKASSSDTSAASTKPTAVKTAAAKPPVKPVTAKPVKTEPVKKTAATAAAKTAPKKEVKSSKTLSLHVESSQPNSEPQIQAETEPIVENVVRHNEEIVVEENVVNNVVVVESENLNDVEQVEHVEVVEQVIEQEVVETEQEVVEGEVGQTAEVEELVEDEQVVEQPEVEEQIVEQPLVEEQIVDQQVEEEAHPVDQVQQVVDELNTELEQETESVYPNESPNLSPVKKDFASLNGQDHTTAPVSEEQVVLSTQNGNLEANTDEIVSGNIQNGQNGCQDDVMTRSFIEDASDPSSNPFNPVKKLDESCDLNRTHELFQDEESSNNSKTEEILNAFENIKFENNEHNQEINLLELPSPVNPDNVGLAVQNDKKSTPNGKKPPQPVSPSQNVDLKSLNKNTATAPVQKSVKSGPIHPVYVELTYIPAHGNQSYVDVEFFKRVRARHYVLSSLDFGEHVLNALLDGKETWEDKNLQVTLIPTYESDLLRRWFENNQERLARLKVEISPAARHSTITIDDNPDLSCQVYKLEF